MELSDFLKELGEFLNKEITDEEINKDLKEVVSDLEFMKFSVQHIENKYKLELDTIKLSAVESLNDLFVLINHPINIKDIDIEVTEDEDDS